MPNRLAKNGEDESLEVLSAGRTGVSVRRTMDQAEIMWVVPDAKSAKRSLNLIVLAGMAVAISIIGGLVAFTSATAATFAAPFSWLVLLVSVGIPFMTLIAFGMRLRNRVSSHAAILSRAGVSVDGGPAIALSPPSEISLRIEHAGTLGLSSWETLSAQPDNVVCGLDITVAGERHEIARSLTKDQARWIAHALSANSPASPLLSERDDHAEADLDRLRRTAPKSDRQEG